MSSTIIGRYRRGLRQYMSSVYVASLYPAIKQEEFYASIARINIAYAPDLWMYASQLASFALIAVGFALFTFGGHRTATGYSFSPLVAVGVVLFLLGAVLGAIASAATTRVTRIRLLAALDIENAYYSQRVPPATLRLRETQIVRGSGSRHLNFNIVIDVCAQVVLQPAFVAVTNNYYQPSPMVMPGAPVQYAMGAPPVMQPSSPPRFYGGAGGVAPLPPVAQQQPYYGQQPQPFGQPQYGSSQQQPQQYWQQPMMQQAPNVQQQQQPQYYNLPNMQQQQQQPQPPAYMAQTAQPYPQQQPPQPFEEPVKPSAQPQHV